VAAYCLRSPRVPLRVVRLIHESGVIDRADGRSAKPRVGAPE